MRISSAAFVLLLAACGAPDRTSATAAADPEDIVECALAGAATFSPGCVVERSRVDSAAILVVRHPDGGFRRFEVLGDGRGVAAADGAEPAQVTLREGGIEVSVGADRYRLPATVRDDGGE